MFKWTFGFEGRKYTVEGVFFSEALEKASKALKSPIMETKLIKASRKTNDGWDVI